MLEISSTQVTFPITGKCSQIASSLRLSINPSFKASSPRLPRQTNHFAHRLSAFFTKSATLFTDKEARVIFPLSLSHCSLQSYQQTLCNRIVLCSRAMS